MKNVYMNSGRASLNQSIKQNDIGGRIIFSLLMRTLLFIAFGALFVGFFALKGNESPLNAAQKWWPFQAIFANVSTFFILRFFMKKEGLKYLSIFNFKRGRLGKDILETLWLIVVGFVLGGIPLYIFSYLLLGSFIPPDIMFQKLPVWAVVVSFILFPLSNGLVETPTYVGYALPRIHASTGKLWLAILLSGLALALQHVALPLVFDGPYLLWRFLSFVPLAIALGIIFARTNRLAPIALAHFFMDLQLMIQLVITTLS